jgi:hypothetical protein
LRNLRTEFQHDPALARQVIETLPSYAREEPRVLIRCDAALVQEAICRAIALAVVRRELARIEIFGGKRGARSGI